MLRPLRQAALGLLLVASVAGCVSMPNGGPVQSYPVTQGPSGKSQPYNLQIIAQPPVNGWSPQQVVQGFLAASASFGDELTTAREYLTTSGLRGWQDPAWSACVFSGAPSVGNPVYPTTGPKDTAQVAVSGNVQASLNGGNGGYAVPTSPTCVSPFPFTLVKVSGQWRISAAPSQLLLTSDAFQRDYQPRNLYFFDPAKRTLVPDPVYVPLQATQTDLLDELVDDLIRPPADWLTSRATVTAFPARTTRVGDVTLTGGTAAVNLGGAIAKATWPVLRRVSAQLVWTLSGSGQGGSPVQSVELYVNGKAQIPPGTTPQSPVQNAASVSYNPALGASSVFYYLDGAYLMKRDGAGGKPVSVARVGTGYSQIAVSPDGKYLAALRNGMLFSGPILGPLTKRAGTGYLTISWDDHDNVWATTNAAILMLPGSAGPGQQPVAVDVRNPGGSVNPGPFSALQVAPDGVRVAVIVGGYQLSFGAIVFTHSADASQQAVKIELSPFYVEGPGNPAFQTVSWYGPDNVITLSTPGPVLTEYPVNGGSSTSISTQANIESITASSGNALIAGVAKGGMMADSSLTGAWTDIIGNGGSPAYPG